jgi:hypothetical protein
VIETVGDIACESAIELAVVRVAAVIEPMPCAPGSGVLHTWPGVGISLARALATFEIDQRRHLDELAGIVLLVVIEDEKPSAPGVSHHDTRFSDLLRHVLAPLPGTHQPGMNPQVQGSIRNQPVAVGPLRVLAPACAQALRPMGVCRE